MQGFGGFSCRKAPTPTHIKVLPNRKSASEIDLTKMPYIGGLDKGSSLILYSPKPYS